MINRNSQKQMEKELAESDNIAQAFSILNRYYDLDNCRPGKIVKGVMINSLVGSMATLGAKAREAHK